MEYMIILALVVVLLILWLISTQRRLAVMDEAVNNAINQIGVQLSGRFEAVTVIYNDSVSRLNRAVRMFPTSLIAPVLGFSKRRYLEDTKGNK